MKLFSILLAALASIPLLSGAAAQDERSAPPAPVVVFLVRHAEALPSSASERNPALSEEGVARAAVLARLLGEAGVTHLFASEYTRTQATLAPLAEAAGLEVVVVSARDGAQQVEELAALPAGSIAVVAGHSNTVPALTAALGGEMGGLIEDPNYGSVLPHDSYDRIAQMILPPGEEMAVRTVELRYGE